MELSAGQVSGGIATAGAAVTLILWGVPYYIDKQVERRMNELAIDPSAAPAVVANTTKLETLAEGQTRIEGKVDAFSTKFMEYLERQAQ